MERRYRSKKVSAMQQSAVIEQRSSIPANCPKFKVRTNFDESSAAMPLEEVYPSLFLFSALTSCRVVLTFWSSILSSTQYHAWSLPRVTGFFSGTLPRVSSRLLCSPQRYFEIHMLTAFHFIFFFAARVQKNPEMQKKREKSRLHVGKLAEATNG